MRPRSQKIVITPEASVLRALRLEHGLSMKHAGELMGMSDSTVAHIENGPDERALGREPGAYAQGLWRD